MICNPMNMLIIIIYSGFTVNCSKKVMSMKTPCVTITRLHIKEIVVMFSKILDNLM